jgi:hypothetical protein
MTTSQQYIFGSDRPLLYDVEPWNRLGFAVPNFGDNVGTLALPIWALADEIARSQLFVMTRIDAQRTQPPSRNNVERIGKLINRVQSILVARMKTYSDLRVEEGHASADLRPWQIHPVPFFSSAIVRNHWLAEYNNLVMIGLTNIYQHSDNNLALTVTEKLATDVWVYFREIQILLGTELLLLPPEVVKADGFLFTTEHFDAYDPTKVVVNYEPLDTPGPIQSRSTEDDLRPLFEGYPANLIQHLLKQYPIGEMDSGRSGQPLPQGANAPGTPDEGVGAPGRTLGEPQM